MDKQEQVRYIQSLATIHLHQIVAHLSVKMTNKTFIISYQVKKEEFYLTLFK